MANGGFARGIEAGRRGAANPFAVILKQFNKSFAERRADDKKRAEEERQLRNALVKLGAQKEADIEINKAKAEEERRTGQAIVDSEGKVIGFRPKGSVFRPGARLGEFETLIEQAVGKPAGATRPATTAKPARAQQGRKVRVIDPNGNPGFIPTEQLDTALKQGFKRG